LNGARFIRFFASSVIWPGCFSDNRLPAAAATLTGPKHNFPFVLETGFTFLQDKGLTSPKKLETMGAF
jgi:hypothetical protein